jgi:hypothetical protein
MGRKVKSRASAGIAVTGLLAVMLGCSLSVRDFYDEVREAGSCEEGDACVVLNLRPRCLCQALVNESEAQRIWDLSYCVDCSGEGIPICIGQQNPRCEDGRCVSDTALAQPPGPPE